MVTDPPASLSATVSVCTVGPAAEYAWYCSAIWWRRSTSMELTPWKGYTPPPDVPQKFKEFMLNLKKQRDFITFKIVRFFPFTVVSMQ